MGIDWKKAFKAEQPDVLGVDIGSEQVKLVELRKTGSGYSVTAAAIGRIEPSDQEPETDSSSTRAIVDALACSSTRTRLAVCGVCGPEVAVRGFKFPALPKEEIAGAVLLEAAQVCPFNIEDGEVDYELMPNGDDCMRGVLVAATRKVIRNKTRLAGSADLKCVLMDVDALALLNCFSELENSEQGHDEGQRTTAILNVGNRYATLAIRGSEGLPFARDIAYAGKHVIEQIAGRAGIPEETVGSRLFAGEATPEPDVCESMRAACQKLITDVTETLRYYNAQEKQGAVDTVHVCGGFSLAAGFVELLNSELPAEAVQWNPFDKIRCTAGRDCEQLVSSKGPALAVAAGFAMRSI